MTNCICTVNFDMFNIICNKRLYSTYLLDELFNNLDNVFVKLIKTQKHKITSVISQISIMLSVIK